MKQKTLFPEDEKVSFEFKESSVIPPFVSYRLTMERFFDCQPLDSPIGLVYYIKYRYGVKNKES